MSRVTRPRKEKKGILLYEDFNTVIGSLDYQGNRQQHSNTKSSEMLFVLMEDFCLTDIWRIFHPSLRQYTRHQKTPRVLSRLDFILVSNNFVNNCVKSKILPGIQSDHSVVSLDFKDNQPLKGKGLWKLNCYYLHHDKDFVDMVKDRIKELKNYIKIQNATPILCGMP